MSRNSNPDQIMTRWLHKRKSIYKTTTNVTISDANEPVWHLATTISHVKQPIKYTFSSSTLTHYYN